MNSPVGAAPSAREAPSPPRVRPPRHAAIWLLAALIALFVTAPLIETSTIGGALESVLLSLVMMFAVAAVGANRYALITAGLLAAPALVARWLHFVRPESVPSVLWQIASTFFFGFAVLQILKYVLHVPRVDANVLCAGLSGYLMLGLFWVPAYIIIGSLNPGAFVMSAPADAGASMDGFRAFYFSFITLCTVGYGDVIPASKPARMFAVLEAIAGLFYVAVLISRLVSVYSSTPPGSPTATAKPPEYSPPTP